MAAQILFMEKNKIDLANVNVEMSVTDPVATNSGVVFLDYLRNRNSTSLWATTGSSDAANTEIIADMKSATTLNRIVVVGHNLKSYTLDYWNGVAWVNIITETDDLETTTFLSFPAITTDKIRLTINGTKIIDDDKYIKQLILTQDIKRMEAYPMVTPKLTHNMRVTKMLSGKSNIVESVGAFSTKLTVNVLNNESDINLAETLFNYRKGYLISMSGGDEDQFNTAIEPFRKQDIYLVRMRKEFTPAPPKGLYDLGIKLNIELIEVVK